MQNLEQYKFKILEKIHPAIRDEILRIENSGISQDDKIALFDLDGTLIKGDIGESLFCYLKAIGYDLSLKWKTYLGMLENDNKTQAYCEIITTLKGLSVRSVVNASKSLINSNSEIITFFEDNIEYNYPVPKRIPEMQHLITYLKISGWKIAVISASNHYSVRTVTDLLFKLSHEYVFGMKTEIEVTDNYEDLILEQIKGTVTYGEGKKELFLNLFGEKKPFITAGNSTGDLPFIEMTSPDGFAIICGENKTDRDNIKNQIINKIQTVEFEIK